MATGGQASAAPDDRPAVSPRPGQPAGGDRDATRRPVSPGKQRLHREHEDGENRRKLTHAGRSGLKELNLLTGWSIRGLRG